MKLARQVSALTAAEGDDPAIAPLLARIVDWENSLHARRAQFGKPGSRSNVPAHDTLTPEVIEAYLRGRFPDRPGLEITQLRQLSGGFSKITLIFDVKDEAGTCESLVLRAEQPLNLVFLEGTKLRNEFEILQLASESGLPVAEPLWFEPDVSVIGMPFLVSRRAAGRNFGSRVDVKDTISPALLRDLVGRLVQIHATPISQADLHVTASHLGAWSRHATLTECLAAQVGHWRAGAQSFNLTAAPILERALGWLAHNIPYNRSPPVLLHGDFGLHNTLIGDDNKVSCILDWEAVALGDPLDDLVWLSEGLKGQVERERILSLYEELGGRPLDRSTLPFFDVFCAVRFAATCPRAIDLFEQTPGMGLDALQLGLLYTYHGTGMLNAHIASAGAPSK